MKIYRVLAVSICSCAITAGKNEEIEDHTYAIRNTFNTGTPLKGKCIKLLDFSGTL